MAELTAVGPEPDQWWQNSLVEGEVVRLGRAPRHGWKVPWDTRISREHADLVWQVGRLRVQSLEMAANPIVVGGRPGDQFLLEAGDSFRIGRTEFLLSNTAEESRNGFAEIAICGTERQHDSVADADRRLELVTRLPEILAGTRSDEELAEQLTLMLLEASPRAASAATMRFDSASDVHRNSRPMVRWDNRDDLGGTAFVPCRELIRSAAASGTGVIGFPNRSCQPTRTDGSGPPEEWAICAPIVSQGPDYWCLYVRGCVDGGAISETLRGDLRFLTLLGQFVGALRQVRQLELARAGMSRFFSPTVVESMSGEFRDELLAPKICPVSVLFCDVRGFSRMSEESAADLFPLFNRVSEALGVMTRSIVRYEGVVADFQGDAALGFWGWPAEPENGVLPACQAALAIQRAFGRANSGPDHLLAGFHVGVGLAHGRAVAGKIGSEEHAKVGVFGPVVNLGARLQGMTRQLQAPILMDEATAAKARGLLSPDEGRCRRLGMFRPCGIETPARLSELLPPLGDCSRLTGWEITEFEAAMDALAVGDWSRAKSLLERMPDDDGPTRFYLDYLARHRHGPPGDWDGVISLTTK